MSFHYRSDTDTSAGIYTKRPNRHDPRSSSFDGGSDLVDGEDNVALSGEDPLATQVWKHYAYTKDSLLPVQRMENLTWRMMALALRKRLDREATVNFSSSRPLTVDTAVMSNGEGSGKDQETQIGVDKIQRIEANDELKPLTIEGRDAGFAKKNDEENGRGRRADRGWKPKMRVEGFHTAVGGEDASSESMDWRTASRSRSRTSVAMEWHPTTSGASTLAKSLMMFSERPPSAGVEFYQGNFSQAQAQAIVSPHVTLSQSLRERGVGVEVSEIVEGSPSIQPQPRQQQQTQDQERQQDTRFVPAPTLDEYIPPSSLPAYHQRPQEQLQAQVNKSDRNAEWHAGTRGPLPDGFPRRVRKTSFDHTVRRVRNDIQLGGRHQVDGRPMAPPESMRDVEYPLNHRSLSSHTTSVRSTIPSPSSSFNFSPFSSGRVFNGDSINIPYNKGDIPGVDLDPTIEIASAAAAAAIDESVERFATAASAGALLPEGLLGGDFDSFGMQIGMRAINSGKFSLTGGYGGAMVGHGYDHPASGPGSAPVSVYTIDPTQDLGVTGILGHRGSIDNLHKWAMAAASAASMHEKVKGDFGSTPMVSPKPSSMSGPSFESNPNSRSHDQRKIRPGAGTTRRTSTGTVAAAGGTHTRKRDTCGVSITLPSVTDKKPSVPGASTSLSPPPYYETSWHLTPEELHQRIPVPNNGRSEQPTLIDDYFNDSISGDALSDHPILDEAIPSVDSTYVPDLTNRIVKIGSRAIFDGTYSTVYRGFFEDREVAIKVIRGVKHIRAMRRKIRREVDTWWHFSHPNILPLLGFAEGDEFGAFGAMISPWCHNGNAADYAARGLSMARRIQLFCDVAEGLQYLHNLNPAVVHGDLKPANVLINRNGVAQLCDFGLVRLVHDQMATGLTTTTAHTGTARYLSLELVEADEESIPTTASDMYALGCIGMEFIYSQPPYSYIQTNQANAHFRICREISKGIPPARRPSTVNTVISLLWDILEGCWESNPENRPNAYYIRDYLNQEAQNLVTSLNA